MQSIQSRPLPTFLHSRPNPKFNPKTKPNTNPIAADARYTELEASSASPKSSALAILYKKLGQVQHINNKSTTNRISGVWALMSTAISSPSDVSNGIHTSHRHTDGGTCMPGGVYISKDVRHSLTSLIGTARRDRVGSAPPPRQPVSRSE